jgi:Mg-chelatase subunit ChlD
MFPGVPKSAALKNYRKLCAALNEKSKVLETMLCTDRADEVEPSHIPSLAMDRKKLAILNEKKGSTLTAMQEDTGNRTTNPKRIELRRKLLRLLAEKGRSIKGARLYPHDLVRKFMCHQGMSKAEKAVSEAQWVTLREELAKGPGLGNKVALMDVSGSMSGTPMEVSIALGILISELTSLAFRNMAITFHEKPSWVRFPERATLEEKVRTAMAAPWGGSTNFSAAMQMILDVCIRNKVRPEDVPGLIVLSDMQFDQADCNYKTMHEQLVKRYAAAGYPMPQITYFNLRANTTGQPVKSDTCGTRLVSGWSPSILKALASDDMSVTPMQTLFDVLDDPRYDPIRVTLSGQLPGYFFTHAGGEVVGGEVAGGEVAGGGTASCDP